MGFAPALHKRAHIGQASGDCRGRGHGWTHQVRAASSSLPALEVAIRCRCAALARPKYILVHAEAHGAAGIPPFETGINEDAVQSFPLCSGLYLLRARHDHRTYSTRNSATLCYAGRFTQILEPGVGAGAEEYPIDRQALERNTRAKAHVVECTPIRFTLGH